ncbi:MAG: GNAT family N-acetyltransferase [Bacteroidia bacterium]
MLSFYYFRAQNSHFLSNQQSTIVMQASHIRKGAEKDLPQVHKLIYELAVFERAPEEMTLTLEQLQLDFAAESPAFHFFVAENDGKITGMALYFFTYSTWKGKTLYLEDLVVQENWRCKGIGSLLFEAVLNEAHRTGARRMAWQVLEWNNPAIEFYKKYKAELDAEWINGRLREQQISQLATH